MKNKLKTRYLVLWWDMVDEEYRWLYADSRTEVKEIIKEFKPSFVMLKVYKRVMSLENIEPS